MRQSQLPVFSPTSTGSKFGHTQNKSIEKSIDPMMKQSQMINSREVYTSGINQLPIGNNNNLTSTVKNSQTFQPPQPLNHSYNPLHALRPLQP